MSNFDSWERISKGDRRALPLADRHYTRNSPGANKWTRPGYNHCLYYRDHVLEALWCWWRPKWEHGTPGTSRYDGLRAIECTMFRREGPHNANPVASEMIRSAVHLLTTSAAVEDLHLACAGPIDLLITGVKSNATTYRRSPQSTPGQCFIHAGWSKFDKRKGKADTWLSIQPPWCSSTAT